MDPSLPDRWADQTVERPRARTSGLLTERIGDETLVYDLESHRAHCLNPSAAHVWGVADGSRTVAEIAATLPAVGLPADVSVVALALDRLGESGLLIGSPGGARRPVTRRAALRALGLAAGGTLLLPAVESIHAPLAAQAASCVTVPECVRFPENRCTGLPICQDRSWCCQRVALGRSGRAMCRARPC